MDPILVVADKPEMLESLQQGLTRLGYTVAPADSFVQADILLSHKRFSAVVTDLRLSHGSGLDVLKSALDFDPLMPVVILAPYGSVAQTLATAPSKACEFVQRPLEMDHLGHVLARAIERQAIQRENFALKEELTRRAARTAILGQHVPMQQAIDRAHRLAAADSPVLLLGEDGTGKELFARTIHGQSQRGTGPFVTVRCGSVVKSIDDELFGFRQTVGKEMVQRPGAFDMAQGGTLFLDKVVELPLSTQTRLLQVLEEGLFERRGVSVAVPCNVRLIATSHRTLEDAAHSGAFLPELYQRLAMGSIVIPALRDRESDVLLLANHFLQQFGNELGKKDLRLTPDAQASLKNYSWPGNVRELRNTMERMALLHKREVSAVHLALPVEPSAAQRSRKRGALAELPAGFDPERRAGRD